MSYEGYCQCLCANGHYFVDDGRGDVESTCPECKSTVAWSNGVDDTNCDSYGEIDMEMLIAQRAGTATCNLGHVHETSPAIYRIPTPRRTKELRCYRPGYGGTPLVPLNSFTGY